jgi:hypothetical protein
MVTLTRDFHVFTSRVTASLPAVFFSVTYITKAWYVRAFFRLLIRHCNSILSNSNPPAPITEATNFLDVAPLLYRPRLFREPHDGGSSASRTSRITACSFPNIAIPLKPCAAGVFGWRGEETSCLECQQADSAVGIWTGLSRLRVLWSRLACAIVGEPLLQRPNLCSRKPALPNTELID